MLIGLKPFHKVNPEDKAMVFTGFSSTPFGTFDNMQKPRWRGRGNGQHRLLQRASGPVNQIWHAFPQRSRRRTLDAPASRIFERLSSKVPRIPHALQRAAVMLTFRHECCTFSRNYHACCPTDGVRKTRYPLAPHDETHAPVDPLTCHACSQNSLDPPASRIEERQ